MMHAVLADRAEQRFGEPAVPAAAQHEQVGAVGGIEQHLGGIALDDVAAYPDVAARVDGAADRVGESLLGDLLEVVILAGAHRDISEAACRDRIMPRGDGIDGRAGQPGLPDGPAQRAQGRIRTVDARHDAGLAAVFLY